MIREVPHFSIIVPAYNAANYVRQTVESVIRQTEIDWQLIVVDDGSTDCTSHVVEQFADPRITLICQERQGVSIARNVGFTASCGEYVLFLDADDILYDDALHRLGRELDDHPEAVLAYGTYARFQINHPSKPTVHQPLRWRPKPSGEALASLLMQNALAVGGVLASRQAIACVRGFDPLLTIGEDWAFWCDLAAIGPIRYVGPEPVFAYRSHWESATRRLSSDPTHLWNTIDTLFAREAVWQRFSVKERARLRRHAEAFVLGVISRELLRKYNWRQARRALCGALKRDPGSIGDWFFLPFAFVGWLPGPARRLLD